MVSCLPEAERCGADEAIIFVQPLDPKDASLEDFRRFAKALGLTNAGLWLNQAVSELFGTAPAHLAA